MKGLIIGLAAGMAAGALLAVNCKECKKMIEKVSGVAEKKMQSVGEQKDPQPKQNECECGEDCNCAEDCREDCVCEERGRCDCEESND